MAAMYIIAYPLRFEMRL